MFVEAEADDEEEEEDEKGELGEGNVVDGTGESAAEAIISVWCKRIPMKMWNGKNLKIHLHFLGAQDVPIVLPKPHVSTNLYQRGRPKSVMCDSADEAHHAI